MKQIFYYIRGYNNKPAITVCLLVENGKAIARGVAICTFNDNPSKKKGRSIALARALKAAGTKASTGIMTRRSLENAHGVQRQSHFQTRFFHCLFDPNSENVPCLSRFNPRLDAIERSIVAKVAG